jgi:molybdopterin-guanine dinucleotide biosynthesis protein
MNRPLLIGIGASQSGAGKTTLAAHIIRHLTQRSPSLPFLSGCGAIKYTRTSSGPEIISDRSILMEEGKDTRKMLDAGAAEVVWVKSALPGLPNALAGALSRLSHLDVAVVEGNSAIEFLNPDIVIFIFDKGRDRWKPGIEKLAARADIIFAADDIRLPADVRPGKRFPGVFSHDGFEGFLTALVRMIYERRVETRDAEKGG